MSNLTINRLGPEAQNDSAWHDEDIEASRFRGLDVAPRARGDWGDVASMCVLSLALAAVFWGAAWYTERQFPPDEGWLLLWRFLIVVFSLIPLFLIALESIARWQERRAYVARARLARDRLMNPVPADLLAGMTPEQYVRILELHAALERDTAPHRAYRGVESLSISAPAARAEEARKADAPAPALPVIERLDDWLDDVATREAHILLSGKTASGKTATGAALLAARIDAGDAVLVLDPHHEPSKWWGIDAVGAGRDYAAIRAALEALEQEMTDRFRRLSAGEPVGERLTVLIDEAPAIAAALEGRWKALATRLGSEARKARISLIILSQSPLVEDLMMNSVMRRNYTIIGLDMASIRVMLRDARNARDVLAALEGRPYPALREVDGEFRICDRTGIQRIRPVRAPRVWRPSCPAASPASETGAFRTDGRADAAIDRLAALIRAGVTREEARAAGHEFANDDWTRARRIVEADAYLRDLLERDASRQNGLDGQREGGAK